MKITHGGIERRGRRGRCFGLVAAVVVLAAGAAGAEGPPEPCFRRPDTPVASLDPALAGDMASGRAASLVYETPLQFDYAARPYRLLPYAAEAMPEVSEDGLEITLKLRDDIWFGPADCFDTPDRRRRATAEDLVYSLKRIADAKVSSSGYWLLDGKVEGIGAFRAASTNAGPTDYSLDVPGLRALDERTVRIRLVRPDPQFLWALAMPYAALVPREAVEAWGPLFGTREAGSGPFTLESWRRGHRMLFVRRPGRDAARDRTPPPEPGEPAGTPYASVEYLGMADASTRWLSFLRGAFDVAFDISRDNWDAVIGPDGALAPDLAARGVRLVSEPALESYYLGFNMDDPVLGPNKKLRQAISCAFDSAQWCALNRGRHLPSTGPLPPGVDGRLETPHPYAFDLERAKALLAEAGYPGGTDPATGRRLALRLSLGKSDQETREGAELLASFLDRIGIALSLDYSTFPQFMRTLNKREEQMFLIGWVADWPDPLNFLQLFVSRNASPGPNRVNYANPAYDALFDEAAATSDPARRRELVGAMQDIVREECPWACLYYRREFVLVGPSILGFRLHDFPLGAEKHWRHARPVPENGLASRAGIR